MSNLSFTCDSNILNNYYKILGSRFAYLYSVTASSQSHTFCSIGSKIENDIYKIKANKMYALLLYGSRKFTF